MEEIEYKALIDEYKMCREDAARLEANIWKTSTILGLSSVTGLILKLNQNVASKDHFFLISAIAFFMITASLVWWRLSRRWWSIQHVKYNRMKVLEGKLGFKQNTLVECADSEVMSKIRSKQQDRNCCKLFWLLRYSIPKKGDSIPSEQDENITKHEHRGNQPAIKLLVFTNIVIWIIAMFRPVINLCFLYQMVIIAIFILYFIVAMLFWRKP